MPQKTREFQDHHFDSTVWNGFEFRVDDIIISTYGKAGTAWVRQIVSQLLFDGAEGLETAEMSPWVDLRVPPKEVKLPMIHGLYPYSPHRFSHLRPLPIPRITMLQ